MTENIGGTDRLRSMLQELAAKRQWIIETKSEIDEVQAELEKTPEWIFIKSHQDDIALESGVIQEITEAIRETGHEVAVELDDKTPAPGLTVRKKTTFEITDEDAAKDWASIHLPMALKLNKQLFTKLVKAMPDDDQAKVDGVSLTVDEFGDVRIATDLSAYLVEHEKNGFRNITQ